MHFKTIYITKKEKARLQQLLLYSDLFPEPDRKMLRKLNFDISQGSVVFETAWPPDVVGIHSRIDLREVSEPAEFTITLVFPEDADTRKNRVSILTPIGMSLMGARKGDIIEYRQSGRLHRVIILKTKREKAELSSNTNKRKGV
jgi:regulator of nucleoside diphosphate kinase